MLEKAFGQDAMSKPREYEWYKHFEDGCEDVEGDQRTGRLRKSTTDENIEKLILCLVIAKLI